jgi:hypothetical protein
MMNIIAASRRRAVDLTYPQEVLADGPIGYWRLNEASGTTMADSSGNSHGGSYLNSPTFGVTGPLASGPDAVSFASASLQAGEVTDRAALDITGSLTLEAWVYLNSTGGLATIRGIISKFIGSENQRSYNLSYNNSGQLLMVVSPDGTFTNAKTITGSTGIGTGAWRHVAAIYIPSTRMEIFVDGVSYLSDTSGVPAAIHSGTAPLWLARQFAASVDNGANARLAECAIYNKALTSTRIAAHYAARTRP